MIGETVSHYRVLDKIGGGGMGVVYRAEDMQLGRVVALKFLNPALTANEANRKRFLREAQAASLIDHPNVCHVYEVEETGEGGLFIAMAYYGGRSLRAALEAGPLPARQAFEIGFSVAQGLWAAHRRGIVHRDIKPGNIVLSDDGFVKIVDFGLALLAGHSRVTTGDARVGTVAYMSPEQASGGEVDERTDIWSLGVVMYELMTGRLPFRGDVDAAILYTVRNEPHTPLREAGHDVPEACARVVERCLAKNPDHRYANAEALLADMVAAAQECGWTDTVASRTIAPILAAKRRRAWARRAAAASVVLVAAVVGWWLWSRRGPPSPYVTELRVAVLPFRNLLGPSRDDWTSGLADHTARTLEALSHQHGSMWVVPYANVVLAGLPDHAAAGPSFGVNRIVTGDVQRVGDQHRLLLELRDAQTQAVLGEQTVRVDAAAASSILGDVGAALSKLLGLHADDTPAALRTSSGAAAFLYLRAAGLMVPPADSLAIESAAAALDSCLHLDPAFVMGLGTSAASELAAFNRTHQPARLQRAEARARRALRLAPAFVPAALARADIYRVAGTTDSAMSAYREVVATDPGNYLASYWLARLCAEGSRVSEAEAVYRDLVAAKPDFWAARSACGWFYYGQDRKAEAEAEWRVAHALAPRDVATLTNLGAIHFARDEWSAARALFLEAFRIRPACESCNNVATTLYFDGEFEESAQYFEFAVQYCDTNDCRTWGNLGSALYWTKDGRERSRPVYRRAIRKAEAELAGQPGDPTLTALLIDYYSMSGDTTMTRATIARAGPAVEENSRLMYAIGSAYEKLGERELALHHIGNALRHGYSLKVIQGAPLLKQLVRDPRFQEMIRTQSAAEGATAAPRNG